jgi:hypothetical protein
MINVVAVKANGLTITGQADSWTEAANEVCRWMRDPLYSTPRIKFVHLSDGTQLESFDVSRGFTPSWQVLYTLDEQPDPYRRMVGEPNA